MEEYDTMVAKGPSRVSPFLVPMMLPDMASGHLSIKLGARGVNYSLVSACASGADCIGEAANIIRRGDAEVAIAGGTEAAITPIVVAGFAASKALSARTSIPMTASRPFDAHRDGFILAEGAGMLVLESEEHALARGATILAELAGYGATSDAFHITQPEEHGEGAVRAMSRALDQADVAPDDIDYINAHGTSTPLNDRQETLAIKKLFGDHAEQRADQLDQVDDWPLARRGWSDRGWRLRARDAARDNPADHPPCAGGPCLRPRLRPERRSFGVAST